MIPNTNSVDTEMSGNPVEDVDYSELTLANDFMFSKVMQDKELCCELLRRVLPELQIKKVEDVVPQKYMKHYFYNKGVRLDAYVRDDRGRRYDVEMQMTTNQDIPKRSRYYASMMDANELLKGADYDTLSDSYVVFICTFDRFHKGLHKYTFRNICEENHSVHLKDGTTKIFLNTKGTADDVSPELLSFLNYLENNLAIADDTYLAALDRAVRNARMNEEWRGEYMTYKDIKRGSYLHGFSEGKAEGRADAETRLNEIMQNMVNAGTISGDVAEEIKAGLHSEEKK